MTQEVAIIKNETTPSIIVLLRLNTLEIRLNVYNSIISIIMPKMIGFFFISYSSHISTTNISNVEKLNDILALAPAIK